jgi:hypothetical protein
MIPSPCSRAPVNVGVFARVLSEWPVAAERTLGSEWDMSHHEAVPWGSNEPKVLAAHLPWLW